MSFQAISEKIKNFGNRVNAIGNTQVFTLEVKNEKVKKLLFLFFILLCVAFVFGLYKIETMSLAGFVVATLIFIAIYLYYIFQPVIITKIIFITLLLLAPISIFLRLQEFNQKEGEFAENIISKIAPQFLKYQYYILLGVYLVFEIFLRLLSRYSQKLQAKIKENPFTIRLYFFIILAIASILIDIFE